MCSFVVVIVERDDNLRKVSMTFVQDCRFFYFELFFDNLCLVGS